jgi:hypothetical protein
MTRRVVIVDDSDLSSETLGDDIEFAVAGHDLDNDILTLLESGASVITTREPSVPDTELDAACRRGGSTLLRTGLRRFTIERTLPTILEGLASVTHIRLVEAFDGAASDANEISRERARMVATVGSRLYGTDPAAIQVGSEPIGTGGLRLHGHHDDTEFFAYEVYWDRGTPISELPFGEFRGATIRYAVHVQGLPGGLYLQWELDTGGRRTNAALIRNAVQAARHAEPGLLGEDSLPHYQLDDRVHR